MIFPALLFEGSAITAIHTRTNAGSHMPHWRRQHTRKSCSAQSRSLRSKQFLQLLTCFKKVSSSITSITTPVNKPKAVDEIKQYTRTIAQQNEQSRQETYDDKIQSWLDPADPHINYKRALDLRHPDSGAWFLQSRRYSRWKTSTRASLWLHGLAGCGKTVLAFSIIKNLEREITLDSPTSSIPILIYFFFDFRDVKEQSLEEMAFSLVYQLHFQDRSLRELLTPVLKACGNGSRKPPVEILLEILTKALTSTDRKVYPILDAFDGFVVPRRDLLDWIKSIAELTSPKVHLLVTSRKESDIALVLGRTNL